MNTTTATSRRHHRWARPAVTAAALALCAGAIIPAAASAAPSAARHRAVHASRHASSQGIVISMRVGPFGPQLVIGPGPYAGFSLYAMTGDTAKSFNCTTQQYPSQGGSFSCTGLPSSQNNEWPALTTNAAPVAGAGVSQSMLGTVYRKGLGHQVTYNGHPLYAFDGAPYQVTGEGWDEPTRPPFHGIWWLVNPDGNFQPWAETLTSTVDANGATVLSAMMLTGAGWHEFPVYAFSADTSSSSACGAGCSRVFPPLLTSGTPGIEGAGVTKAIGTITRAGGAMQVTYNGQPLYLYAWEGVKKLPGGGGVAVGSGNGRVVGGGTFTLVTP